jgi:hypothetical protein
MPQTLEARLSPGSNIFDQPIFLHVFEDMAQIIDRASKKGNIIDKPTSLELYHILMGSFVSYNSLRNRLKIVKKRARISRHIPLAKQVSGYIHRVFEDDPIFREYLGQWRNLRYGIVPNVGAISYDGFRSER